MLVVGNLLGKYRGKFNRYIFVHILPFHGLEQFSVMLTSVVVSQVIKMEYIQKLHSVLKPF